MLSRFLKFMSEYYSIVKYFTWENILYSFALTWICSSISFCISKYYCHSVCMFIHWIHFCFSGAWRRFRTGRSSDCTFYHSTLKILTFWFSLTKRLHVLLEHSETLATVVKLGWHLWNVYQGQSLRVSRFFVSLIRSSEKGILHPHHTYIPFFAS